MFGDACTFLHGSDLPATTTRKLLEILQNPAKCRKLKMELCITVDSMQPFVQATYLLEGDGPLVFTAYEQIRKLYNHISLEHYPNVTALAREQAQGNSSHEQQLLAYAKSCVIPAYAYFKTKFDNDLKSTLDAFKAACYFNPCKLAELKPTSADIDDLCCFPFLKSETIADFKSELPQYLAIAEGVSPKINPVEWWKTHEDDLPNWARSCKMVLLVQPSSAAAERAFSLLASSFSFCSIIIGTINNKCLICLYHSQSFYVHRHSCWF